VLYAGPSQSHAAQRALPAHAAGCTAGGPGTSHRVVRAGTSIWNFSRRPVAAAFRSGKSCMSSAFPSRGLRGLPSRGLPSSSRPSISDFRHSYLRRRRRRRVEPCRVLRGAAPVPVDALAPWHGAMVEQIAASTESDGCSRATLNEQGPPTSSVPYWRPSYGAAGTVQRSRYLPPTCSSTASAFICLSASFSLVAPTPSSTRMYLDAG
jgi:hypothetical protein